MSVEVYLFRHGQTASNAIGRYVGSTDEPLCDLGVETARSVGADPAVREVVVSPLRRTQMTAALLFPNAAQRVCAGLREMTFGVFEGRSAQEMADDPDYRYWVEQTQCMGPCPHGDATLVFQHRVCAAFRREVERVREAGQARLYFVIHGGAIMSIMHRLARPEAPYYSWLLKNCQGYACQVQGEGENMTLTSVRRLERLNP